MPIATMDETTACRGTHRDRGRSRPWRQVRRARAAEYCAASRCTEMRRARMRWGPSRPAA
eukprot:3703733-Pyramimonas_sp.AAC.1